MAEDFHSKLSEIVFETNKVALHVLKVILVRLKVDILLLRNFFAKVDLTERIWKLFDKAIVLICLFITINFSPICLLLIDQIYVFFKFNVTLLEFLNFFL